MDLSDGNFYNPTRGNLSLKETIEELVKYMSEKPEKFYDVVVGCDSSSNEEPHFPVALVALRVGEGGRFFLKKISYNDRKFYSYKTRILEEVYLSCEMAILLRDLLEKNIQEKGLKPNYQFCYIHADVGEKGKTKDMIKEVTGLIRGNGFEPCIKPASFAASVVADRYS